MEFSYDGDLSKGINLFNNGVVNGDPCFILARMGSSRFPGKPMAPISGKPMIGHIF